MSIFKFSTQFYFEFYFEKKPHTSINFTSLMNLTKDFIIKYHRLTTMQPIPSKLGIAKDGIYYWLYYSGMGQTDYIKLHEMEQNTVNILINEKRFKISKEVRVLPVLADNGLVREIRFRIVELA